MDHNDLAWLRGVIEGALGLEGANEEDILDAIEMINKELEEHAEGTSYAAEAESV